MSINVLIVDDEQPIADLVEIYLKNENYNVYKFYTGKEALECVEKVPIDLAVLDVMLPDVDGFSICQKIRGTYFFPIIMLTARVEDMDKIKGLTLGADDYLTKPFNPLELVTRVKTQIRRYTKYGTAGGHPNHSRENHEHDFAGLVINRDTHKCTLYGKHLSLTPTEFSILWCLCDNRGRVVSSEELFEAVWGEKSLDSNNTVMAHIARIREKMNETSRKPKFIKTVWGVGYTIE
jgi:two-component system response regulator VanR